MAAVQPAACAGSIGLLGHSVVEPLFRPRLPAPRARPRLGAPAPALLALKAHPLAARGASLGKIHLARVNKAIVATQALRWDPMRVRGC